MDEVTTKGMLLGNNLVAEWEEGGHLFHITRITPKKVGATVRNFELFCDNEPAYGGRYHSSLKDARERAGYVALGSMAQQITYLWGLVDQYRKRLEKYGDTDS